MAAPGGGKGAWALLGVALLVPCFLFYQWWARMDKAKKESLNQKIRSRGINAFDGAGKNKERLNNPMAQGDQTAAAAQAAQTVAPVPGAQAAPPVAAGPEAQPTQAPAPAPAAEPAQPAPGAEPPPADAAAQPPAPSTAVPGYYLAGAGIPDRDPTLSPYDFLRLRRIEEEKLARILELQERNKPRVVRKAVEPPIERTIDLQGIVSNAEGENKAIINGEIFGEGELINGKVKILRIGAQSVVFAYKAKRFTMSVNQ